MTIPEKPERAELGILGYPDRSKRPTPPEPRMIKEDPGCLVLFLPFLSVVLLILFFIVEVSQ
jgi:hypothetical protein